MFKILLVILSLLAFELKASHIIGGDIYFDYLGNNQYKFYITLYRDCNSTGAQFDDPMNLTIYKADGGLFLNLDVPFPGSNYVPIPFNNPCATPPNNLCVERAVYTIVVNLPPILGGYNVSYQRCCRGPNITNLISPDDTGLTLTTHVPGSETGFTANGSPRFTYYPPMLLCTNELKTIDHSATDPDGDQLVYSLVTPNSGANSSNPMPTQAPPPPYFPIQWASGFSAINPLGPGSTISINAATGIITVDPNLIGLFVVGVRVQEFRNGILVGETVRDFLFRVFDCNITMQAILPLQEDLPTFVSYCQGLTVQFENQSYGGTSYAWDFGVFGMDNDVSSNFEPSYTFPSPGNYLTRLVVNPGMPCTDTAFMNIIVNNPFLISWESEDSICISENAFTFNGFTTINTASFTWEFDADASIQSSTGLNVQNVSFTQPGFHTITLSGEEGNCQTSFTDSVFIFDLPTTAIGIPPEIQCYGLTIPFKNNSINASNYAWDFGVLSSSSDVSSQFEPTYTFPNSGNYTIQLIAGSNSGCQDTASIEISINEPLIFSFSHNDSLCITDGLYNFNGTASGQSNASFLWDFGPNSIPNSATTLDFSGVKYLSPGNHIVKLIGSYDNCKDSILSSVFVYDEPTIDFDYLNTLQCAPSTAQFINKSQSDAPTIYLWDFGDGGNSTFYNTSHIYTVTGSYNVALLMITLKGCIDTLYLLKQDLVQVFAEPIAGFDINPKKIDICEPRVEFIDQSTDAVEYFYLFDNRKFTSNEANFFHEYTQSGGDYPMQVVTNEYGCSDTAYQEVYIEPFAVYVPNTFIPDGNLVNDIFIPKMAHELNGWAFQIYNKWGELLFETDEYNVGWDGTYQNKPCQDDTYIYVLKFKPCDSPYATEQITGFVNLIR